MGRGDVMAETTVAIGARVVHVPTGQQGKEQHAWACWIPVYDYRMRIKGWRRRCEICHLVQERPDYRNYLIEEESTHD